MSLGDNCDWALFRLNENGFGIKDRPSGTHPGTEQGPMRGCLMLRMVPGMFRRLGLRQSADCKNTEHKSY
jgi:hypothetical protein